MCYDDFANNYNMEILNSLILGIVQGITEFLPISSSGHLIITRDLLKIQADNGLAFDSVLQLATTLAVIIYFNKEIIDLVKSFFNLIFGKLNDPTKRNYLFFVIIATVPAVIFGLLFENYMDTIFRSSLLVVVALLIGSLIMYFADKFAKQNMALSFKNSLIIGFFQALALVPGMSRSGMTISGGLFSGLKREEITKFSFIIAIPILLGSGLKKLFDLGNSQINNEIAIQLLAGSIAAFITGIISAHFLIKYLQKHSMRVFVWYRIILSIIILAVIF